MKKYIVILTFSLLVACGPSHEELIRSMEEEYSVLDCDILKIEQDLLSQTIAEEEKSLSKTNLLNLAVGLLSIATTGSGGYSGKDDKHLQKSKLQLEAINNLLLKCSK